MSSFDDDLEGVEVDVMSPIREQTEDSAAFSVRECQWAQPAHVQLAALRCEDSDLDRLPTHVRRYGPDSSQSQSDSDSQFHRVSMTDPSVARTLKYVTYWRDPSDPLAPGTKFGWFGDGPSGTDTAVDDLVTHYYKELPELPVPAYLSSAGSQFEDGHSVSLASSVSDDGTAPQTHTGRSRRASVSSLMEKELLAQLAQVSPDTNPQFRGRRKSDGVSLSTKIQRELAGLSLSVPSPKHGGASHAVSKDGGFGSPSTPSSSAGETVWLTATPNQSADVSSSSSSFDVNPSETVSPKVKAVYTPSPRHKTGRPSTSTTVPASSSSSSTSSPRRLTLSSKPVSRASFIGTQSAMSQLSAATQEQQLEEADGLDTDDFDTDANPTSSIRVLSSFDPKHIAGCPRLASRARAEAFKALSEERRKKRNALALARRFAKELDDERLAAKKARTHRSRTEKSLKTQTDDAESRRAVAEGLVDGLKADIAHNVSLVEDLQFQLEGEREYRTLAEDEVARLEKAVVDVQAAMEAAEAAAKDRQTNVETQFELATERALEAERVATESREEVAEQTAIRKDAQSAYYTLAEVHEETVKHRDELQAKYIDTSKELDALREAHETATSQLAEAVRCGDEMQAQLSDAMAEVERLNHDLANARDLQAATAAQLTATRDLSESREMEVAALSEEVQTLTDKTDTQQQTISTLMETLTSAQSLAESHEKDARNAVSRAEAAEAQVSGRSSAMERLKEQLAIESAARTCLEDQLDRAVEDGKLAAHEDHREELKRCETKAIRANAAAEAAAAGSALRLAKAEEANRTMAIQLSELKLKLAEQAKLEMRLKDADDRADRVRAEAKAEAEATKEHLNVVLQQLRESTPNPDEIQSLIQRERDARDAAERVAREERLARQRLERAYASSDVERSETIALLREELSQAKRALVESPAVLAVVSGDGNGDGKADDLLSPKPSRSAKAQKQTVNTDVTVPSHSTEDGELDAGAASDDGSMMAMSVVSAGSAASGLVSPTKPVRPRGGAGVPPLHKGSSPRHAVMLTTAPTDTVRTRSNINNPLNTATDESVSTPTRSRSGRRAVSRPPSRSRSSSRSRSRPRSRSQSRSQSRGSRSVASSVSSSVSPRHQLVKGVPRSALQPDVQMATPHHPLLSRAPSTASSTTWITSLRDAAKAKEAQAKAKAARDKSLANLRALIRSKEPDVKIEDSQLFPYARTLFDSHACCIYPHHPQQGHKRCKHMPAGDSKTSNNPDLLKRR